MHVPLPRPAGRLSRRSLRVLPLLIAVLLAGLVTHNVVVAHADKAPRVMPQSAALEDTLGVRFTRLSVVADGGLLTLSYVVLDPEKATRFQSDQTHPPVLSSESRYGSTSRVSLMRQGHDLNPGQTYYLVYQDTKGAIRSGEDVTVTKGDITLEHVPVL